MLTKRIIPCLDVDRGRVVKGISFVNIRDAGDPQNSPLGTTKRAQTNWLFLTSQPLQMLEIPWLA